MLTDNDGHVLVSSPGTPVYWPWSPKNYTLPNAQGYYDQIKEGDYISITGSLVMDQGHGNKAVGVWNETTSCPTLVCNKSHQLDNPARWVEKHPPDSIVLLQRGRSHASEVRCVAVVARSTSTGDEQKYAYFFIPPPDNKPEPNARLLYRSYPSYYTRKPQISVGGSDVTGAIVTVGSVDYRGYGLYVTLQMSGKIILPKPFRRNLSCVL